MTTTPISPYTTTTATTKRPGPSPFVTYSCPEWCVRWDHHADLVNADNPPRHYGPKFGIFSVESEGDGEPVVEITEPDSTTVTSADLRKLASDALQAAEWLESAR